MLHTNEVLADNNLWIRYPNNVEFVHKRDFRKPENVSLISSFPLYAGLNYMHIHCSFNTEYEMKLAFVCNDLLYNVPFKAGLTVCVKWWCLHGLTSEKICMVAMWYTTTYLILHTKYTQRTKSNIDNDYYTTVNCCFSIRL